MNFDVHDAEADRKTVVYYDAYNDAALFAKGDPGYDFLHAQGWPLTYRIFSGPGPKYEEWYYWPLAGNVLFSVFILSATLFLFEWAIYRRLEFRMKTPSVDAVLPGPPPSHTPVPTPDASTKDSDEKVDEKPQQSE